MIFSAFEENSEYLQAVVYEDVGDNTAFTSYQRLIRITSTNLGLQTPKIISISDKRDIYGGKSAAPTCLLRQ